MLIMLTTIHAAASKNQSPLADHGAATMPPRSRHTRGGRWEQEAAPNTTPLRPDYYKGGFGRNDGGGTIASPTLAEATALTTESRRLVVVSGARKIVGAGRDGSQPFRHA